MTNDEPGGALNRELLADAVRVELVAELPILALSTNGVLLTLARLACLTTGAPFAQISLISDAQAVPVAYGFEIDPASRTPAADSLCSVTVATGEPFAVTDAVLDPWVQHLPPVASGAVRSYLGAPIFSASGHPIGAICAFGPDPREWSAREMEAIVDLAELVVHEIRVLVAGR